MTKNEFIKKHWHNGHISEFLNDLEALIQPPQGVTGWPTLDEILKAKAAIWEISNQQLNGVNPTAHQQGWMDAMQWIHKHLRDKLAKQGEVK